MKVNSSLIAECNIDTLFARIITKSLPLHVQGSVVQKPFMENPNKKLIGFIDRDKKGFEYFKDFELTNDFGCIQIRKHSTRAHFAIIAVPAMETAIQTLIHENNLDVANYSLPREIQGFIRICKSPSPKNEANLKTLFNNLLQKDDRLKQIRAMIVEHFPD